MANSKLIRITDVYANAAGKRQVTYYLSDCETVMDWPWEAPRPGDVMEIDFAAPEQTPHLIGRAQENKWTSVDNDALRWRRPITPGGVSRMNVLCRRAKIKKAAQDYLDAQDFTEIDAPLLVRGTTPDFAVESFSVGDRYLATSTEYQMKRLAIGGFEKIYSLTKNFRFGDTGTYRNPEFTMLEWGRVGASMNSIESDAENLVLSAMHKLGLGDTLTYQGRTIDMRTPWRRLSVVDAVHELTGVSIAGFDAASCARAAEAAGLEVRDDWRNHADFLFSLLMDQIQPRLGIDRPVFLTDWPLGQTTSAQTDQDRKTVMRSELFIAGIELSDGFAGLASPDLQAQYFDMMLAQRQSNGQNAVDLDDFYVAAMRLGAPYGAGMALGFDRLVMLLTDQPHIRNVIAFNWDEV